MNSGFLFLLALGIGVVAGLRSMTAPAVVAWAAHLGWINLSGSRLAFMGSAWAVGISSLAALGVFVVDQLPANSGAYDCHPVSRPNRYGLAYRLLLRHCRKRVVLGGGTDRSNRGNRRSVRRLSGSRRIGSGASSPGFCNCHSGRSDRTRSRTVFSLQILKDQLRR